MKGTQREVPAGLLVAVVVSLAAALGAFAWARWFEREPDHPIAWRGLEDARRESERSGRPLLIELTADWCAPCRKLDAETLRDAEVAAYVNEHFVPARLINSADPAIATPGEAGVRADLGVESFPTIVVSIPGQSRPERCGYLPRRDFVRFLEAARLRALAAESHARRARESR